MLVGYGRIEPAITLTSARLHMPRGDLSRFLAPTYFFRKQDRLHFSIT